MILSDRDIRKALQSGRIGIEPFNDADVQPSSVDLRVDRLMLAPGTYDLSVSLYDYTCSHAFDFRYRTMRFDIERGDPIEEHGVMTLGGTWEGAVSPVHP